MSRPVAGIAVAGTAVPEHHGSMQTPPIVIALILAPAAFCSPQDAPASWPQFRGPGGRSVADDTPFPLDIGPEKHVLWKAQVPAGHSSPCVQGNRIFLTGYEGERCFVLAIERSSGVELWRRSFVGEPHPQYNHVDSVPALPTACTDGERVIVYHGAYGLLAFDLDGDVLWERRLPHPGYGFGVGTSPILAGGNVILSRDGAPEAAILAIKAADGNDAWKIDRFGFIESHGTPVLWRNTGREELILGGTGQVCSYSAETGEPLWNVSGVTLFSCTTPVGDAETLYFAGWSTPNSSGRSFWEAGLGRSLELSDAEIEDPNLLFDRLDTNGNEVIAIDEIPESRLKDTFTFLDRNSNGTIERSELVSDRDASSAPGANVMLAIRRGGAGDVTKTHVRWSWKRGLPYVASPLLYRGRIWLFKSGGMVTCLDAETGDRILDRERLPDRSEYYMSPVGAAGHVLAGTAEGNLYLLNADGDELDVVHTVDFGEGLFATPAVVEGKVYLRSKTTLWALGG